MARCEGAPMIRARYDDVTLISALAARAVSIHAFSLLLCCFALYYAFAARAICVRFIHYLLLCHDAYAAMLQQKTDAALFAPYEFLY